MFVPILESGALPSLVFFITVAASCMASCVSLSTSFPLSSASATVLVPAAADSGGKLFLELLPLLLEVIRSKSSSDPYRGFPSGPLPFKRTPSKSNSGTNSSRYTTSCFSAFASCSLFFLSFLRCRFDLRCTVLC